MIREEVVPPGNEVIACLVMVSVVEKNCREMELFQSSMIIFVYCGK